MVNFFDFSMKFDLIAAKVSDNCKVFQALDIP
jgi:hypothetical protein